MARNPVIRNTSRGASGRAEHDSQNAKAGDGYVVGVDIGGSNLRVALADMRGNVLGKWSTSTERSSSPAAVIKQICEGVTCLLQRTSLHHDSLRAVAAGVPGVTNADTGLVLATSYLGG